MSENAAVMPRKKRRLSLSTKKSLVGLLFISPFLVGFSAFFVRGLYMTVRFSFSELTIGEHGGYTLAFEGWKHYIYAFAEHPGFKQVLTSSLWDIVLNVPMIIFFSLFIAVVLNQEFRGRTVARAIFFLPVILNGPAILDSLNMARAMILGGSSPAPQVVMETISGGTGNLNMSYYMMMFEDLGLPAAALEFIVGVVSRIHTVITSSAVQIVIFLAALQAISPSLYEVAKIEGATAYETFWKITFPMVAPLIVTNIVYTMVAMFWGSRVLDMSYDTIFGAGKQYELGSAFSLISMAIVLAIMFTVTGILSKLTFYQN
jgi:ABC-type sugar transport system permease subunit